MYRWDEKSALVQTVDFFTPIVDDPATYGAIAAANALSDVYAMGGRPLTALAVAGFPKDDVDEATIREIFLGGLHKLREAGVVLLGGHTVQDGEIKFGYAVTGVVSPDAVWTNAGARAGDALFLTKPIGTGIIATAIKNGLETEETARGVIESMATLNRLACEAMVEVGVHAATDVTGFGLIGHVHEMASASGVSAWLDVAAVPIFDRALGYAADGVIPGRTNDLLAWAVEFADWRAEQNRETWLRVLLDPQTSGGLLMAVAPERADALADALTSRDVLAARVGGIVAGEAGRITLR